MTSAILTSFTGASFVGMTIVGAIVEEPEGWRILRIASGIAFGLAGFWSIYLYRRWAREQRGQ
jgi:hypothetical protein